jgi:ribulose-5-phosphate 4-epimerase/fuculose-1-phosphate aldolase
VTARVPDEPNYFLVKPHHLTFEEVTASSLLKFDYDGRQVGADDNVNPAAFTIHTAVLKSRPEINCVAHVHTVPGIALAAHETGLRFFSQETMMFYGRIGYHEFEGIADATDESARIARDLGAVNKVLVLRNHGILTCGESVQEAVELLRIFMRVAEAQMMLEATGTRIREVSPELCAHTALQFQKQFKRTQGKPEWEATLRKLDRVDGSFRD